MLIDSVKINCLVTLSPVPLSVGIELVISLCYLVFVKEDTCNACLLPGNSLKWLSHYQKSFGGGQYWKPP